MSIDMLKVWNSRVQNARLALAEAEADALEGEMWGDSDQILDAEERIAEHRNDLREALAGRARLVK